MWRGIPKACSSRSWLISNSGKYLIFTRNRANFPFPTVCKGNLPQTSTSSCCSNSQWFATQSEAKKVSLYTAYGEHLSHNDSDSVSLTDEFGSLSLDDAEFLPSPSSSEFASAPNRLTSTIPTTVARSTDPFTASVKNYFDSLEGDYDISGILCDFAEANKDHSEFCASQWLSGPEKLLQTRPSAKIRFINYPEKKPVRKPVGLRQKHLLARWRAANRKSAFRHFSLKPVIKVGEAVNSKVVDEVEGRSGLLLYGSDGIGAGALSSHASGVLESSGRSVGFLSEESSYPYPGDVQAEKTSSVTEEKRVEEFPARRDRFDPLDVRAQTASVEALQALTYEKDIEGLRTILNENRWPGIQSVRSFISELFKVFVDLAADVDEIKFLMWDFAATDNRAFVADSIALLLLERIIREEGLHSAMTYAKQHRDLFLVRPPMERNRKSLQELYEKLFMAAIKAPASDLANARAFVDSLIELGYLKSDCNFFLFLLSEELRRSGFDAAFQLWSSNVQQYRSSNGIHILMRAVITEMTLNAQEKHLSKLLQLALQYSHPYAALGDLIVELVIASRFSEAEVLLKKLTISGHHLRIPLNRLKGDAKNLAVVERVSELVTTCLFAEKKASFRKKKVKEPVLSSETMKLVDSISQFLISKWTPHKKKKYAPPNHKTKRFVLDPEQTQELTSCIQEIWTELAGLSDDIPSLDRLHSWCLKNNVEIERKIIKQCQEIYSRNSQDCPFREEVVEP